MQHERVVIRLSLIDGGKTVDADHERCRKRDRRTRREGRRRTCGRPPRRLPAFETPVSVGRARFRGRRLLSSLRGECRQPRPGNARTRILHVCFVSHPSLAVVSRFNGPAESRLPWSRKPTECLGSQGVPERPPPSRKDAVTSLSSAP